MIRNAVFAGLACAFFAQPALALDVQKGTEAAQPKASSQPVPPQLEKNTPPALGRKLHKTKQASLRTRKRDRAGDPGGGDETSESKGLAAPAKTNLDSLISQHAKANGIPEDLVHRVVKRESRYNPRAVGRGGAMGLMQIKHGTARALGYAGGSSGLLSAETNLTYGVRYLAGAYRVANGDQNQAVAYYARGYYYDAKRRGLGNMAKKSGPVDDLEEVVAEPVQATASLSSKLFGNPAPAPYGNTNPK